jgi:hypothetical protein
LIGCHARGLPHCFGHFTRRLVAVVGILAHRFEDHPLHGFRDVRLNRSWQRQRVIDVLHDDGKGGIRVEGNLPRHHLVEYHAQRIDIAALISTLTLSLLGRHINWRS